MTSGNPPRDEDEYDDEDESASTRAGKIGNRLYQYNLDRLGGKHK
jgi:hypothetical protein